MQPRLDYKSFPVEIWLHIVGFLAYTRKLNNERGRAALANLTLTSKFFRSLAQPPLFLVFAIDGIEHTSERQERALYRLRCILSAGFAPFVKEIHILDKDPSRDEVHNADIVLTEARALITALAENAPQFTSIQRVRLFGCIVSPSLLDLLFGISRITDLTIVRCRFDLGSTLDKSPLFRLRKLCLTGNRDVLGDQHPDDWWSVFLTPALETLLIPQENHSEMFITLCTSLPSPTLDSLRYLQISPTSANRDHFGTVLSRLPALETLSLAPPDNAASWSREYIEDVPSRSPSQPSNQGQGLKRLNATWELAQALLPKHPLIQSLVLGSFRQQGPEMCFDTLRTIRPGLSALTVDFVIIEEGDMDAISLILTELPSLEECVIFGVFPGSEEVFQVIDLLQTVEFTPSLRNVRIGSETQRSHHIREYFTAEFDLYWKLKEQCPDLRSLILYGRSKMIIWLP